MKEPVTPPIRNSMFFEEDPKGIPAGVQVKGLTKVMRLYHNSVPMSSGRNFCGLSTQELNMISFLRR